MSITVPTLPPAQDSLFLTLCGRALDSRSPHPLLADTTADQIVDRLGYDISTQPHAATGMRDIALRAKKLDRIVSRFIDRHPDAVVLDLGAGLDTRMIRVDPPPSVDWYDIDVPAVTSLRDQVVPHRDHAHTLGADLTDPHLLDDVTSGRPAVIVADGLLAFLTQPDFIALLHRLVDDFPAGEIAFNGYTRFHVWALKHYGGTAAIAGGVVNPGFDDPREPERWEPRLKLVEEILLTRAPEIATYPTALRAFTRLAALSTRFSRRGTTVLRYSFDRARHQD